MKEKKSLSEHYAEALREAGILVTVFGPLYCLFDGQDTGWVRTGFMVMWGLIGVVVFHVGIWMERSKT